MSNYIFVVNDEPIKMTDRELMVLQMMKRNAEIGL